MEIALSHCVLRPWRQGDQAELVRQANNLKVAMHLRDLFPHPYTARDAEAWIACASRRPLAVHFAIAVNDKVAGGIGLLPGTDINRVQAEVGYWLGEEYWGRGIATEAVRGLTGH